MKSSYFTNILRTFSHNIVYKPETGTTDRVSWILETVKDLLIENNKDSSGKTSIDSNTFTTLKPTSETYQSPTL